MKHFELEKLKFEREQLKLALDKAADALDLSEVEDILQRLDADPLELKELQSKTSQLPHLYKKEPKKYAAAKKLADAINEKVTGTRQDKSHEQQDFLSINLLHKLSPKELDTDIDDVR